MSEREELLDQAIQAFAEGHRAGTISSISQFLHDYPSELHIALLDVIEEYLYVEAEMATLEAPPEILAQVDVAYEEAMTQIFTSRPLTELRKEKGLLLNKIARHVNLPPDFFGLLERGGVTTTSIPPKLIGRLATTLQCTEQEIKVSLRLPAHMHVTRLSAGDAAKLESDTPIDFAEALRRSAGLTPEMRADWLDQPEQEG